MCRTCLGMFVVRSGCIKSLVGFVLAAVSASPVAAIRADPLPRICNEFPRSDYVFSGRVLSDTYHWHEFFRGEASEIYRIKVDRVFKGQVPEVVRLYTSVDSGRGTLNVGQPAIVFAYRQEGHIAFDGSSISQSGSGAAKVIAKVQQFLAAPPRVATISGRIDGWPKVFMEPLPGVRLLLSSGSIRKFVRSDAHGRFLVTVTPGVWSVRIAKPGWASRSGSYTYDSAERTRLKAGGCADVELETARPDEKLEGPYWERWPK